VGPAWTPLKVGASDGGKVSSSASSTGSVGTGEVWNGGAGVLGRALSDLASEEGFQGSRNETRFFGPSDLPRATVSFPIR
jgi:hypothetical protein